MGGESGLSHAGQAHWHEEKLFDVLHLLWLYKVNYELIKRGLDLLNIAAEGHLDTMRCENGLAFQTFIVILHLR